MKDLETRKRLLLAESDVHRIELARDFAVLKEEIARLKRQARTVGSVASSAALFAGLFSVMRRRFSKPTVEEPRSRTESNGKSWIAAALEGARLGGSLFLKIRSILRERDHE